MMRRHGAPMSARLCISHAVPDAKHVTCRESLTADGPPQTMYIGASASWMLKTIRQPCWLILKVLAL